MHSYDRYTITGPNHSYSIDIYPDNVDVALRQKDMTLEKFKEIWELDLHEAIKALDSTASTIIKAITTEEAEAQKRKENDAAWDLVKSLITTLAPDDETKDSFHEHEDDFHNLFEEMAKAFSDVLRNSRSDNPYSDFKRAPYNDPRVNVVPTTTTTAISDSLGRKDDAPHVTLKQEGNCTTATYTIPSGTGGEKGTVITNDQEYLRNWLRKHGLK